MVDSPSNNRPIGRSPATISPTFCAFPFTHLVVHNNGTYGPCCGASEYFFLEHALEPGGVRSHKMFDSSLSRVPMKPYGLGIEQAFYSEPMVHIRQELLKGNKPSACESCWIAEEHEKVSSKRQTNNNLYFALKPEFEGIYNYDAVELATTPSVRSLDLKFSNKCNLHCLMCNTGNSDMWIPLDEKINQYLLNRYLKQDVRRTFNVLKEAKDTELYHGSDHTIGVSDFRESASGFPQHLFEEIKALVPQLEEIQCTGGEPFVSKQFIELLEYAIETGHAGHITLEITTNGTKFVTDVMELLTHFKHIRFLVSIDGTGSIYDYIRAPFKYDILLERLHVLQDYMSSGRINAMVDISCVAMSYNLFNYYNLDEVAGVFTSVGPRHYFHNLSMTLYNDDHPLHIKWLPNELLNTALEYYLDRDVIWHQLKSYIDSNQIDQDTKLHNQRRMKNYTLLMDEMLDRDYHDFLDPRLIEFLDSVESDL
tara:strand:- start:15 stop:1457 length:1443 start_codon:yes stop_codon:yes gene_type:complete